MDTRKPAVAGRFYPSDAEILEKDISNYFKDAGSKPHQRPAALLVPHAGYVFSGPVAAEAFSTIPRDAKYKRIFIIGSSHTLHFEGASIYSGAYYQTPLGDIPVDKSIVAGLKEEALFNYFPRAHQREHALEVQIPFIQHLWGGSTPIVPILLGDVSKNEIAEIAEKLSPYFNRENLFVISTDFSHFPEYADAIEQDNYTAEAITKNNFTVLEKRLKEAKQSGVAGLATPLCGWTSVLALVKMTEEKPVEYRKLTYRNSGDSPYGNHNEVVGYWAISVEWKATEGPEYDLNHQEKETLLRIARNTLKARFQDNRSFEVPEQWLTENLKKYLGAFVSIYNGQELRGCIGSMKGREPLYKLIGELTISAALNDYRFKPVKEEEVPELRIEISVLTPMVKVTDVNEIISGKHGVYVTNGWQNGTLLPQVGAKMNWSTEELLGHCARDKAGMGWEGWKNADVYKYEAVVFKEGEEK